MPHELFEKKLSQKIKIRNASSKNISSKAQLSKTIQSGGFLGNKLCTMIGKLCKKALTDLAVPLTKDVFPKLTTKAISGKRFTLFIFNEDMDDTIKIVELLKGSGPLTDGAFGTAKYE